MNKIWISGWAFKPKYNFEHWSKIVFNISYQSSEMNWKNLHFRKYTLQIFW